MMLDETLAANVVRLAIVPMVEGLMGAGMVKRPHLALVVALRDGRTFHDVYSYNFGDPQEWENPYDEIAYAKTEISARTGLSSRVVQELRPELLLPTDVKFWGNWIEGDIIVSCSGVQPWFDEAISKAAVALLMAGIDDGRHQMAESNPDALTYDGTALESL